MSRDRCIGILFLLFCALLWFYLIPTYIKGTKQAVYPQLIVIILAIPSVGMLFRKATPQNVLRFLVLDLQQLVHSVYARTILLVISYAAYLLCVDALGFFSASGLFCLYYMCFFGERTLKGLFMTPAILLGCTYCIIALFLKYPLPKGLLF